MTDLQSVALPLGYAASVARLGARPRERSEGGARVPDDFHFRWGGSRGNGAVSTCVHGGQGSPGGDGTAGAGGCGAAGTPQGRNRTETAGRDGAGRTGARSGRALRFLAWVAATRSLLPLRERGDECHGQATPDRKDGLAQQEGEPRPQAGAGQGQEAPVAAPHPFTVPAARPAPPTPRRPVPFPPPTPRGTRRAAAVPTPTDETSLSLTRPARSRARHAPPPAEPAEPAEPAAPARGAQNVRDRRTRRPTSPPSRRPAVGGGYLRWRPAKLVVPTKRSLPIRRPRSTSITRAT